MVKTQLLTSMGIPPKAAKLTELMSFVHHLLSTVQNYEHVVHNKVEKMSMPIPPKIHTNNNQHTVPPSVSKQQIYMQSQSQSQAQSQAQVQYYSQSQAQSQSQPSSHSMRMTGQTDVLSSYKDNKKKATNEEIVMSPPPIENHNTVTNGNNGNNSSSPLQRSVSSMYAGVDVITAPDVQPRYNKTLPIRAYSTSFSSQPDTDDHSGSGDDPDDIETIKSNSAMRRTASISHTAESTSFNDIDRSITQRKKNTNVNTNANNSSSSNSNIDTNGDGDILHDRLLRAQNAFASMREPKDMKDTKDTNKETRKDTSNSNSKSGNK